MLFIHGVGLYRPKNEIDNAFLERLEIGTTDEWILRRVGIRSRRTVLPLSYILETRNARPQEAIAHVEMTNTQTAVQAARSALQSAGLAARDIGMVIAGGCSPQYTTPAESCTIAGELGIQGPAFDINSGCSTFCYQLHFLASMQSTALPDYVLVVNPENNTRMIDYNDRSSAVLWGDASTAMIVSPRVPADLRVKYTTVGSDPSGCHTVSVPPGKHFQQDGAAVQVFAVKRTLQLLSELRERSECGPERLFFIGHQANLRMLQTVAERAELAADRHLYNVDRFGNCGAAGAPSVLSEHWGRFTDGDEIAVATVGAGLSWGGALIDVTSGRRRD